MKVQKEKLTYLNKWTLSRGQNSVAREVVKTSGERPYLLLYRTLQAILQSLALI